MKLNSKQVLKAFSLISALLCCYLWIRFYVQFFSNSITTDKLDFLIKNFNIVTYPFFGAFSLIILLKANSQKGVLFFSLFLSQVAINIVFNYVKITPLLQGSEFISASTFLLTSFAYIKAFQNFPQEITKEDVYRVFSKAKLLRGYLTFFLNWKVWLVFPLVIVVLASLFPGNDTMRITVLLLVLFTAILFMYINFRISNPSSRNKIMWLIWGVLCYTFITLLLAIMLYSYSGEQQVMTSLFRILRAMSLFISVTMCLFFFDTFDTGVMIKRTIVDGIIFVLIVLLYNSVEHYALHWLSHRLHISNTLVSSFLSGFFVLLFSPVHHKFMRVLDVRFKKKPGHGEML